MPNVLFLRTVDWGCPLLPSARSGLWARGEGLASSDVTLAYVSMIAVRTAATETSAISVGAYVFVGLQAAMETGTSTAHASLSVSADLFLHGCPAGAKSIKLFGAIVCFCFCACAIPA